MFDKTVKENRPYLWPAIGAQIRMPSERPTLGITRMRGFCQWRWYLDEMYVKRNGEMDYLWRTVDQEGEILESYITKTRDKEAALTFMKKALKRHGLPERITTDGLRSYRAAMKELGNAAKQEIGRTSRVAELYGLRIRDQGTTAPVRDGLRFD